MVAESFKYELVSLDTMNKQINVRLPKSMLSKAEAYAKKHGFATIQELIKASLREKFEDEFLRNVQQPKMKELWDNKEDEAWENA